MFGSFLVDVLRVAVAGCHDELEMSCDLVRFGRARGWGNPIVCELTFVA